MNSWRANHLDRLDVKCNGGLLVFVDNSGQTVKPRLHLGTQAARFNILTYSRSVPKSAQISELRQMLLYQNLHLDPMVASGIDIYCVTDSPDPANLVSFLQLLADVIGGDKDLSLIGLRAHCFAAGAPDESSKWRSAYSELKHISLLAGGGLYLLSTVFRSVVFDRLRSYPLLAKIMKLFALTSRSRFQTGPNFTERFRSKGFGMYLAAIESYECPPIMASAEYLLDRSLFFHLNSRFFESSVDRFPSQAIELRPEFIEYWMLSAARKSTNLDQLAETLEEMARSEGNGLLTSLAIQIKRSLTYSRHLPEPEPAHIEGQEVIWQLFQDAALAALASASSLSLIERFPFPLHPFFSSKPPSLIYESVLERRVQACEQLAAEIRKAFYRWAWACHHSWLPPNVNPRTIANNLMRAMGFILDGDLAAIVSCHVDPSLTRDTRDELCEGPERIHFLNLLAIG